jgi:endonuclease/exonuclease/phosphatase family metal-dependent hydrolase
MALLVSACASRDGRPATLAAPTAAPALAVITWNMHAGRGDLPRLLDDLASGRLTGGTPAQAIVLLQEAIEGGEHDVAALARERGLHAFYNPVRQTGRGVSGNAIMSTRPLLDPRVIELPRVRQARDAIAVHVESLGTRLVVVNAHLENRVGWLRGGLFSDGGRARQVDALLQAIPSDGPAIVGGDLNTWLGPSEKAWKALATRFPDTREPMEPTFRGRLTLDHVFVEAPPGWIVAEQVLADAYGSDHTPVVATVSAAPVQRVRVAP